MQTLNTIKGTATNRGKARVWIESSKLASFGFTRGTPITVRHEASGIVVTTDPKGSRIVAGRERGGKEIGILDLGMTIAERDAMFGGAERLLVSIDDGIIVVGAAK